MKKTIKKLIFVLIALGIICAIMPIGVKAALQSNGDTPTQANVNDWMWNIRQMQATGQTLGLTDTINTTNLTSGNKNLDIHMQKNTEYGAMVLLGVSQYGNPNKLNTNGVTTTGNKTGIVLNINKEWVAAGMSNTGATTMKNASNRYKNQYTAPNYTEKVGDAVYQASGNVNLGTWHGGSDNIWLKGSADAAFPEGNAEILRRSCVVRSYKGSVFSYYGDGYWHHLAHLDDVASRRDADYRKTWSSRAAVVVGSGV